jgi:hypothetical protein
MDHTIRDHIERENDHEMTTEGTQGKNRTDTDHPNLAENALENDYAEIALLMKDLDLQVKNFTTNMCGIIESAGPHDVLSALWEAHKKDPVVGSNERQNHQRNDDAIHGDEAEDANDPLIFL